MAHAAFTRVQTFQNPHGSQSGTLFGRAGAGTEQHVIVGAPFDATDAPLAGAAYLFDPSTGDLLRELPPPQPGALNVFGLAVAVGSDGVFVGAPFDDLGGTNVGAVHLFDPATGTLLRTFPNPEVALGDEFGHTVATSGHLLLVGAPMNGAGAGAVYVLEATTGAVLRKLVIPGLSTLAQLGHALTMVGNRVVIGAPGVNAAYVFDPTTGALLLTLANPHLLPGGFGTAVAAVGADVVVGAPLGGQPPLGGAIGGAAYLFNGTTGELRRTFVDPAGAPTGFFGQAVAGVGNQLLVGAPGSNQARLFDAGSGVLLQTLPNPDTTASDFGAAVGTVGGSLLIGAPGGAGLAHLFAPCGNGTIEPGEECDDGNQVNGDCCTSTCRKEPEGQACDDADSCTGDDACYGGECLGACQAGASCGASKVCQVLSGSCVCATTTTTSTTTSSTTSTTTSSTTSSTTAATTTTSTTTTTTSTTDSATTTTSSTTTVDSTTTTTLWNGLLISGAETGDLSEATSILGSPAVSTATVRTGTYGYKIAPVGTATENVEIPFIASSIIYTRFYLYVDTLPTSTNGEEIWAHSGTIIHQIRLKSAGTLAIYNSQTAQECAGSTVLSTGTWYRIEQKVDRSTNPDTVELRLNGATECTATANNANSPTAVRIGKTTNRGGSGYVAYYDDIAVRSDDWPGPGRHIVRQGTAGTPTDDAFTKSCTDCAGTTCAGSCATGTACCAWSETPFGATKNATTANASSAQTVLIAPFSATQTGHGSETIANEDTVHGCTTALIHKVSSTSGMTVRIRRRIAGSNTDTDLTESTSDVLRRDGVWSASPADLDSAEAGALLNAGSNLLTVEDAWMMCDFAEATTTTTTSSTTTTSTTSSTTTTNTSSATTSTSTTTTATAAPTTTTTTTLPCGPSGGTCAGDCESGICTHRGPAIAFVKAVGAAGSLASGNALALTVAADGVPVGHAVIVTAALNPNAGVTLGCSDSRGNTYTKDADVVNGSSTTGVRTVVYSTSVSTALQAGDTITLSFGIIISARAASAHEFSGLVTSALADQISTATGTSTTPNSGATATTAQAGELLLGAIGIESKSNATFTTGTNYTVLAGQGSGTSGSASQHVKINPEYQIVSSTGTYAADGTIVSVNWAAAIVTYKGDGTPDCACVTTTTSTTTTTTTTSTTTGPPTTTTTTTSTTTTTTTSAPPSLEGPPVDQDVPTVVGDATQFLYTGPNPVQHDVAPGTIERRRAAVVKGRVLTTGAVPLAGVTVSIKDHPEYGWTASRSDGEFDLAVNGGAALTVQYEAAGYFPAHRDVHPPWNGYVRASDVTLVQPDSQVTTVLAMALVMQVAIGSLQTDADGMRQPTLLVPAGTEATMRLPDGTTVPLPVVNVRLTEYTVGPEGPSRMPAVLPPASAYTYALEMSADEAIAADADTVMFNQALPFYVENFLDLPVGGSVPLGYYDRTRGVWVPDDDGRVVRIVSVSNGMADLDLTGDGNADDPTPLGVTDAERSVLAGRYAVGQSLWRVAIWHFTPQDLNWPYGPPDDAERPDPDEARNDEEVEDEPCETEGCIIEVQRQTLRESVRVVGTPFRLSYSSARVPGRVGNRKIRIPLSGPSVPASLKRIELEIGVAGRGTRYTTTGAPNQEYTFVWDGMDVYGRPLIGAQHVAIQIGYVYDAEIKDSQALQRTFALFARLPGSLRWGRAEYFYWRSQSLPSAVWRWDSRGRVGDASLGGWRFDVHHTYDPVQGMLWFGNGTTRRATAFDGRVVETVAGTGVWGDEGDGGLAIQAKVTDSLYGLAVGADGTIYLSDWDHAKIRSVRPDGTIGTFAGNGDPGCDGEGIPATTARVSRPQGFAVARDGSLYFGDADCAALRRVAPDGIIHTAAAGHYIGSIALAPDGAVLFTDDAASSTNQVWRLGTDGAITLFAGDGTQAFAGDGGPALAASLAQPLGLAVTKDGDVYVGDFLNYRIRRIGADGTIDTYTGTGSGNLEAFGHGDGDLAVSAVSVPENIALGADGSLYESFSTYYGGNHIRRISADGIMSLFAGERGGFEAPYTWNGFNGDGRPATDTTLYGVGPLAEGPDGNLYFGDRLNHRVRRVRSALPGLINNGEQFIASADGSEIYVFAATGRHLRTLEARTKAVRHQFSYDGAGRLIEIRDGSGNSTSIDYSLGHPVIGAPGGQTTTVQLDGNGWAERITNPAGEVDRFAYTTDGLLTKRTSRRGHDNTFTYDASGRLSRDDDPAGGSKTLDRALTARGQRVTVTTGMNRETSYLTEKLPDGSGHEEQVNAAGFVRTIDTTDGTTAGAGTVITDPSGQLTTRHRVPHPAFGMQAPVSDLERTITPDSYNYVGNRRIETRSVTLADPLNPLSATSEDATIVEFGFGFSIPNSTRTSTWLYDAATRTRTHTSPEGRIRTLVLDPLGRASRVQYGGLAPSDLTYTGGLLTEIARSDGVQTRRLTFGYDTKRRLTSIADAANRTVQFGYDDADRVTTQTFADGKVATLSYDAAGNVVGITPPSRPAHTFAYTPVDLEQTYTPPAIGGPVATTYTYNADRQLTQILRPDGQTITFGYDPTSGRLVTRTTAADTVTFGYHPFFGWLSSATSNTGETLVYSHDGALFTGTRWSGGPVQGSVAIDYNGFFRVRSTKVNTAPAIARGYDLDDLLTQTGALTLTRDPQHGLVTGTTLGGVRDARTYNAFGELETFAASPTGGGSPYLEGSSTRDVLGRIETKSEAVQGTSHTTDYVYDLKGRLESATTDGTAAVTYTYDDNGNRLTRQTSGGGLETGTYDDQDRLLTYADATYTYTANGELQTKIVGGQTTTYEYDVLGNLRRVTKPGGTVVDYLIDPENRRMAKKVNGSFVQTFLHEDGLRIAAELDSNATVVSRFVYGTRINVPEYMVKGGVVYRIVTDHLGSPRLVIDTASGVVAQRMDYDEFGRIVFDTNPGFQPFGFAGGLYDTDTGLTRFGARDYDPVVGRWATKDPIRFAGGDSNLYGYVFDDPVNLIDSLGLTQQQIDDMLNLVRRTQTDLNVPDDVGVGDISWMPTNPVGFTNPITKGVWVDDRYLADLDCEQLKGLSDTLIHESIHRTRSRFDMVRRPSDHPDIYEDARKRAKALEAEIEKRCECE